MKQSPEARYPAVKPVNRNGTSRPSGSKSSRKPKFNQCGTKDRSVVVSSACAATTLYRRQAFLSRRKSLPSLCATHERYGADEPILIEDGTDGVDRVMGVTEAQLDVLAQSLGREIVRLRASKPDNPLFKAGLSARFGRWLPGSRCASRLS